MHSVPRLLTPVHQASVQFRVSCAAAGRPSDPKANALHTVHGLLLGPQNRMHPDWHMQDNAELTCMVCCYVCGRVHNLLHQRVQFGSAVLSQAPQNHIGRVQPAFQLAAGSRGSEGEGGWRGVNTCRCACATACQDACFAKNNPVMCAFMYSPAQLGHVVMQAAL